MRRLTFFLALGLMAWALPLASEETTTLNVSVTAVSGRSVFLDKGRNAGLAIGQRVFFYAPGEVRLEGFIKGVTSDNARVDFSPNDTLPPVGTKGEVDVPLPEPEEEVVETTKPLVDHTPWERQLEVRSEDTPLLAPAFGQRPEDRPIEYRGRVFGQLQLTRDSGGGRDNENYYSRVGTRMEIINPFKKAGRILFAGQGDYRASDSAGNGTESDTQFRTDRLSYAIGGQEHSPYRLEVGRFYSIVLPELGLMDGLEGMVRLENGWQVGMGTGFLPLPFPDRETGEDVAVNLFATYQSDGPKALAATMAYQKSWHHGNADRDVVVGRLNLKPTDKLWLYGTMKADFYSSEDSIKGQGVELTEFWGQARYVPDSKKGASVSVSHFAWPELKRRLYKSLPVTLVKDGRTDRVSLSGWYRPKPKLRVSGRVNVWEDNVNSGHGGEVNANWRDLWRDNSSLFTSLYYTSASQNNGTGFRINARQQINDVGGFLGYELFLFRNSALSTGSTRSTRHTLRSGLDWTKGDWSYNLTGDYFFGDDENSLSVGLYTDYRF